MKIDELAIDHFDNADDFGKAMELLLRSTRLQLSGANFDEYEELFLSDLDQYDDWLLTKAERYKAQVEQGFNTLKAEIETLRQALSEGGSNDQLVAKIAQAVNPELPDEENPTFDELLSLWKEKKSELKSFEDISRAIELFIRFANDFSGTKVRVAQLSVEHIHYYQEYYSKIPLRVSPKGHSISELIKLDGKPKSPKTISDNYAIISSFFSWVGQKGFPINPQLKKILTQGSDVKLDPKFAKSRKPYTDQELSKLFNSDEYLKSGNFKTSGMYWVPILAIFTGARMTELLQLEKHDITMEGKYWVINIDDIDHLTKDKFKHVKRDGSRRIVPIHKQILDLGFIDYVKKQGGRLFGNPPEK